MHRHATPPPSNRGTSARRRMPFMILLATAASVIASQATISGAFSLARQAVQLDLLPRLRVLQTSSEEQGQIYVPAVNAVLFVAVASFVLTFRSSDALSAAYGAAVIGNMAMTTVLGSYVAWTQWNWPKPLVVLLFGLLGLMDGGFLIGNLTKVPDGGWIPLAPSAIPQRADFNTLDNPFAFTSDPAGDRFSREPSAGVHFVVFNPSGDDFERNRLAMDGVLPDGTKLPAPHRSRAQRFNSVLTTTHRQNFLVPPRRHRSFPLAEL